jgi:hypothetical protein
MYWCIKIPFERYTDLLNNISVCVYVHCLYTCLTPHNKLSDEGENVKLVAEIALQMSKIKLLFFVT